MDFIGDETATRHALEEAFRLHEQQTREAGVPLDSLPAANVFRAFIEELHARGWKLTKIDLQDLTPPEDPAPAPGELPSLRYNPGSHTMTRCRSFADGDCVWSHCPQIRDGEPHRSGRHCPLDKTEE